MKKHTPGLILISLLIASYACQIGSDNSPPAENVTATIIASAAPSASLDESAATATAAPTEVVSIPEFIALDLEVAGYTADQGELVWMQSEELALIHDGDYGHSILHQALDPGFTAANFVFSTDLEWDSAVINGSYNYPACGVIFRAEDVDHGEQARFKIILVNPTAYPAWVIELWNSGQYQSTISTLSLSTDIQGAGSTNHFLIVADGSTLTVFANGTRLNSVMLKASLSVGEFGILALAGGFADPGITSCIFTNTWVWELP